MPKHSYYLSGLEWETFSRHSTMSWMGETAPCKQVNLWSNFNEVSILASLSEGEFPHSMRKEIHSYVAIDSPKGWFRVDTKALNIEELKKIAEALAFGVHFSDFHTDRDSGLSISRDLDRGESTLSKAYDLRSEIRSAFNTSK